MLFLVFYLNCYTINSMSKVIATDLDGTLFYPKRRIRMITKKSLAFLRRHIDNGGRVVIVSGRNSTYLKKVRDKIDRPVDMIGCNSAFIVANDEFIKNVTFEAESITRILKEIDETYHPRGYLVMSEDGHFISQRKFDTLFYKVGYALWNAFEGTYKEPFRVDTKLFNEILESGKARKIMVFFGIGKKNVASSKEANKGIREKYSNELEASWSNEFIELSPFGCSKSEGLKYYLDYLKIKHSDIYVVGDSGNDISMFNSFPEHSFCMDHASLSVSKYAKHTLKRFADLEKYIDLERK